MTTTKYKLKYRPFPHTTLTYSIKSYEVVDGVFIKFYDEKDKITLQYPVVKCEIIEVPQ